MIVIDDGLVLALLSGSTATEVEELRPGVDDDIPLTTGSWYFRLCRAVVGGRRGRLTKDLDALDSSDAQVVEQRLLQPPPDRLRIIGMADVAPTAALLANQHRLNSLSAEALALAFLEATSIVVSARNDGPPLRRAAEAEGIEYRVVG